MPTGPRPDLLAGRTSGLLVHPTSLPGPGPIGGLGPAAFAFVDLLAAARQSVWQMLPLGPTPPDGSPYRALSAFAGNPWLVAAEPLVEEGLLPAAERDEPSSGGGVDYGRAAAVSARRLDEAYRRFVAGAGGAALRHELEDFRERAAGWLDDYAFFMALKRRFEGRAWLDWPIELATRQPEALKAAREAHAEAVSQVVFEQLLFHRQWTALKRYAEAHRVSLIGDIPIYVDLDSADAWANQSLFELDETGRPRFVAGVPPDYFSKTGQRWGNPLYDWKVMAERGYDWWIARFRRIFELVDVVRIDHFRGFQAYWRVPAEEPTAVNGAWVEGPGASLFEAVAQELGSLAVIAEDLGLITEAVKALRRRLEFPGMKILQFAFHGDPTHPYLPERYDEPCVVYPGTHDNDTTAGWYAKLSEAERAHVDTYLGAPPEDPAWALIRLAWESPAVLAVATLQDALSLGTEARMNTPGLSEGNWTWRLGSEAALDGLAPRLARLTESTGRVA